MQDEVREQAREKIAKHILHLMRPTSSFIKSKDWQYISENDKQLFLTEADSVLRLLPFPDEQGKTSSLYFEVEIQKRLEQAREDDRKTIGDWLEKYRPYILDRRFHKGVASLKAGEPPQGASQ